MKMLKIKTKCGIDKYKILKGRKGVLNKFRLYWFILIGGLRDFFK